MTKITFPAQPELQLALNLDYGKYKLLQGVAPSSVEGEGFLLACLVDKAVIGVPNETIFVELTEYPGIITYIKTDDVDEANDWFKSLEAFKI